MKRQQKSDRRKLSQKILTRKVSCIAVQSRHEGRRVAEYKKDIHDRGECKAKKNAVHYISCSSCQHGGQNDGCNNHHLLRKSDERELRPERPQAACSGKRE